MQSSFFMQKAPKFRAAKLAAQLRNFYLSATYLEKPPFALRHIVRRFARNFFEINHPKSARA